MMAAQNYFSDPDAAKRYAKGRPKVHAIAIARFRAFADTAWPVRTALDVGCGTGQSSVALTEIADRIVGIDASSDMLGVAELHPKVEYRQSQAEQIPFGDSDFDLICVALAFHWLDQDAFLAEANRLLASTGWLLIYGSWFQLKMKENAEFTDWFKNEYFARFPSPPRNRTPISDETARRHGFELLGDDEYSVEIPMTIDGFTDYQLSTTNVLAAVESGADRFGDAEAWVRRSLEPFFEGETERTFIFTGKSWYLRKIT